MAGYSYKSNALTSLFASGSGTSFTSNYSDTGGDIARTTLFVKIISTDTAGYNFYNTTINCAFGGVDLATKFLPVFTEYTTAQGPTAITPSSSYSWCSYLRCIVIGGGGGGGGGSNTAYGGGGGSAAFMNIAIPYSGGTVTYFVGSGGGGGGATSTGGSGQTSYITYNSITYNAGGGGGGGGAGGSNGSAGSAGTYSGTGTLGVNGSAGVTGSVPGAVQSGFNGISHQGISTTAYGRGSAGGFGGGGGQPGTAGTSGYIRIYYCIN